MNLREGPQGPGGFAPNQRVECDYVDERLPGRSPKFTCAIAPGDHVKVKFGRENGEVYAEVAATRLLWALGFAADRMYPVRVVCRRCPRRFGGVPAGTDASEFDYAAIERKLAGREVTLANREGWTWPELDAVQESAGGAPRSQRDALALLAAVLQHTDSKSEQQRLLCFGMPRHGTESCEHPVAMINDLGMTFGRASELNRAVVSSVNLPAWAQTSVWVGTHGCVANIARSYTGTLDHPRIAEEGRLFLAGLLSQLTDAQLVDLFDAARFQFRRRNPSSSSPELGSVEEWISAFKAKRDQVAQRRCDN